MDNQILSEIINYAQKKLTEAYGYCGVANGEDMAILNSEDRQGGDIKILIQVKK